MDINSLVEWIGADATISEEANIIVLRSAERIVELPLSQFVDKEKRKSKTLKPNAFKRGLTHYVPLQFAANAFKLSVQINSADSIVTVTDSSQSSYDIALVPTKRHNRVFSVKSPSPDAVKQYLMGVQLLKAKKFKEADIPLNKAIEMSPNYTDAIMMLAENKLSQELNRQAIELYTQVFNKSVSSVQRKKARLALAKLNPSSQQLAGSPTNLEEQGSSNSQRRVQRSSSETWICRDEFRDSGGIRQYTLYPSIHSFLMEQVYSHSVLTKDALKLIGLTGIWMVVL